VEQRRGDGAPAAPLALALEGAGAAALFYAGWLGGVLVSRNLIGVDHRYAGAGKWKEATLEESAGQVTAADEDELQPGQMKLLHVGGRRIVLGRTARGYVAFDDRCTHRGGSLAGGVMIGATVQCLWHGSQFDVEDGSVRCGPAKESITTYPVQARDGRVIIQLSR
jgi:nitrite reductase/ring-hydroxylating ferredoxin subunit